MRRLAPVWIGIAAAALLWGAMFGLKLGGFWMLMTLSAGALAAWGLAHERLMLRTEWTAPRILLWGLTAAGALYAVFALGEWLTSSWSFQDEQIRSIYSLRRGWEAWTVALLLLFLIGPAEEIFWRGFVQKRLADEWGAGTAFVAANAAYTLVHVPSGNLMLVGAAGFCGLFWGWLYLRTRTVWPGIVSHAVWDVAVFILFPLR